MKKKSLRKLNLSRETLSRLEDWGLEDARGGVVHHPSVESICFCLTDLCISEGYTGCVACNS
ncbi:MAG TPA: class I lanthipeptide [Thermoanaerobaculia bacterium]|nr:class I lanthipeptide [Thermoanaerobaculia bacterium]